ncbi:MAG: UDP-N-acetylmuramoyl-L-alanyl-D-glutamate--2,6-diaminopimelate ligase [Patescibacteria group bacterium]
MLQESLLDKILYQIKKLIPTSVFNFFAPAYHTFLAYAGAFWYGFPSRSMKVIGVTGTKGKSSTVYLITKILEETGHAVAAIGSLGYKIKEKEWPNTLKMTMPGRFRLQKFLYKAKRAGCEFVVLEVTSEGIAQGRIRGITFDCAVFTNLHREHIESHGTFENYRAAKLELFRRAQGVHVINADDEHTEYFGNLPAQKKIFFGIEKGDIRASNVILRPEGSSFTVYGTLFQLHLVGRFNILNALGAMSVAAMYGIDLPTIQPILASVKELPGRMQFIPAFVPPLPEASEGRSKTLAGKQRFNVVIDYAHTPDSLKAVYETLKKDSSQLVCVLGAAGGGRDTWKRKEFGTIAERYCDAIILTDEDPYEENPTRIIKQIQSGMHNTKKTTVIMDRRKAIQHAVRQAQQGDTVVITGKGSETSMAIAGGKKIPWSDAGVVQEALKILEK